MPYFDPPRLRSHQIRVLRVLSRRIAGRAAICQEIGWSPTSGTFTNAVNGVKEGSSTGGSHPGLVRLGLVEKEELDIDGLIELRYRITAKGRDALTCYGEELPNMRDKEVSTNLRYK